jgi:radical SAM superfamily enzyme YgiQ (UPF0313 family)
MAVRSPRAGSTSARRGRAPGSESNDGRAILAREVGAVHKPHGGRLRIALAFPNTYFVGMSNLGLQTVYRLFNADERVVCERVFLPPRSEVASRRARREPLVTIESGTPIREFDVFAFSVSFEWDYPNVVTMLRLAGVEPRADRRHVRDPLIVVGGAVTFVNPEPLAPFADLIAAGEAELLVPSIVDAFAETGGRNRPALLERLAAEPGCYVPSLYEVTYDGPGRVAASSRQTRSSDPACSSRSCAGARTCAGSAGLAITICPSAPFRPPASWKSPRRPDPTPTASASSRLPSATIRTSS